MNHSFIKVSLITFCSILFFNVKTCQAGKLRNSVYKTTYNHTVDKRGKSVKPKEFDQYLIYFSAHWCPPCRAFTPLLAKYYKKNGGGTKFDVIFVSKDKDEDSMYGYMRQMPWNAVSFKGSAAKQLGKAYPSRGIPHLVAVNKNGKVLFQGNRNQVLEDFKKYLKTKKVANTTDSKDDVVEKIVEKKSKRVIRIPRKYVVNAIMESGKNKCAIINGDVFQVGQTIVKSAVLEDVVNGKAVVTIGRRKLDLKVKASFVY